MCPRYAKARALPIGSARLRAVPGALLALLLAGCAVTSGTGPASDQAVPSQSSSVPTSPTTSAPAEAGAPNVAAEPALPPEASQQFDRAVVMMTAGDAAAAEQAFQSLAAAYPAYSGALLNLGILQGKAGRWEEAEKTIRSAIERNSGNAAAFNQLGIVLRRLGRFSDADAAYQRAITLDPNYANAYLNLGVLCDLYLQQPQRALEAFERYLQLARTPDQKVSGWISELKARLGQQRTARAE